MSVHDIQARVLAILQSALKCPVSADTRREDIAAWDSLKHIEIVFAIEDELQLQFTPEQMGGFDSAASIIDAATRNHAM